uniref:Uncharacterized protein n=1 Tax=Megaselia scalaris TaxID=36166 RepID=T1GK50_MEGSC
MSEKNKIEESLSGCLLVFISFRDRIRVIMLLSMLLQNLGKVDRTADEIFDEHLTNFTKQNASASKLQKEFNNYIRCPLN